jgi:hypothetical protein
MWTIVSYFLVRAVASEERRAFVWAGVAIGITAEAKYGVVLWAIGLIAGLAYGSPRRLLSRELWLGFACAFAIALPNILWQAVNGFPFLEVVRNDNAGNLTGSPIGFAIGQILAANIVLFPLVLAGVIVPFVRAGLARFRFLSIAFVVTAVLVFATHGKSYYLAGAYPSLFALGAAACTGLRVPIVVGWMTLTVLNAAFVLPLTLPVLAPDALADYIARTGLRPRPVEAAGVGAPLTQVFSDEFGWRELEHTVARVYRNLPPDDRKRAGILASNYGEAAAIDVYGTADHLPPAISEQDQYYLWGPRGYDGSVLIAVNANPERWSFYCGSAVVAGTFGVPYAMPYERDRAIVVCRNIRVPLQEVWSRFKRYGL